MDDDLSLNFVQQALVHEERKLQRSEHESNSLQHKRDSALLVQKKGFKPRRQTCHAETDLPCGHFRSLGHIRRDCPNKEERIRQAHKAQTAGEGETAPEGTGASAGGEGESKLDGTGAFAALEGSKSPRATKWLVDSGASHHMTWDRNLVTDYQPLERPEKVGLGDGHTADAIGFGNVHLEMIFKVLYVPQLAIIFR